MVKVWFTTVKYYNKKDIIELWQKINDVKRETGHLNISDTALRRIKKYCGKKIKDITEKEKRYKAFFKDKDGIFIIEKLTRDIIERCKLPKAIELRKKLGYNHNNIMIREETAVSQKIIKLFPHEILCLIKNLITENQIFALKIIILLSLMKKIMKIMTQMMKRKEKICLKSIILKFFDVIPMILSLIFSNF